MELPKRKQMRLKEFNYNTAGAYFITFCVKDRQPILSETTVGANSVRPKLTKYGEIVDTAINEIPKIYNGISVDNYVIMPDHVHLLLQILSSDDGRTVFAPTIGQVIKQTKGYVTKQVGFSFWQKSFHDHVIRNENDYKEIWEYIENNPTKLIP